MKHTRKSASAFAGPVNLDAERAVLGAVLLCPALLADLVAASLVAGDFSLSAHREIYQAMLELHGRAVPLDVISLAEQLGRRVECVGGVAYLSELPSGAIPQRKHVLFHAGLVKTKARLRSLARIAERFHEAACQPGADPQQLAGEICAELTEITKERGALPSRTEAVKG
ncbi:MAG: DnaB-like helicase N-terminal domain-containing protein [Terriglobales bacterium]